MAFADPQTVTINAVAQTLPRISSGESKGVWAKDDGTVTLTVSHQKSGGDRRRRQLRLDHTKIAADPMLSGVNVRVNCTAYLVVDVPPAGYTIAEQKQIVDALTAYLTASSGARATQLLGAES